MGLKFGYSPGVTLLETLIYLIVTSILIFASYLYVPPLLAKARDAQRKTDFHKISQALEHYYNKFNSFPPVLPDCRQPFYINSTVIMDHFPCDPKTQAPYYYQPNGQSYQLYTNLENTRDSIIASLGCDRGCGPDCFYNYGISSSDISIDRCLPPPIIYACSPGGGQDGLCQAFDDPLRSQCPITFPNDPTCHQLCGNPDYRCKNSSGKHIPE